MTDGRIVGPYRIIEEIDSGGMAHVYRAEDRQGRFGIVALKVMREEMALGTEYRLRFRREARIWAELDHPNIVPLLDYSTDLEHAYVAMRYIDGCSLHDLLAERGSLPVDLAVSLMKDILSAVAYAHEKKVIHRDIKPDNVLLDREGRAYLTDFGIAKPLGATELTNTGARLGTPVYMAPEQIRARKDITARADIYSLGVLFYEMLSGRPPFVSDDPMVLSHAHCYEQPPPLKRRGAPFPAELQALVMKCLEKEPRRRPRSAASILKALERFEKKSKKKSKSSRKNAGPAAKGTDDHTIERAVVKVLPDRRPAGRRGRRKAAGSLSLARPSCLEAGDGPPVAAFLRVGALILIGAMVAGMDTPELLLGKVFDLLHAVRVKVENLFGGDLSAEAVDLLRSGHVRLGLYTLDREVRNEPRLKMKAFEMCSREARSALKAGRLHRAQLFADYCVKLAPDSRKARFLQVEVLLARRRGLQAAHEYERTLASIPDYRLLEHVQRHGRLIRRLPARTRRELASRLHEAGRRLVMAGHPSLARPYGLTAAELVPESLVYRRFCAALDGRILGRSN